MTGALAAMLVAGLALRLIIAYLLPGSGFKADLDAFHFWAANLAQQGPWGFYDRSFFHDYTPGYLYILWGLGILGQLIGGLGDLIKLPAMLGDLAIAYLAWSMVQELGGSARRGLLAAALVLFLPITWFDSVVWGQVDSVGVVFLLLALRETWRDRPERAAIFGTIAAITKPQLGIIVPIVAAVVIRRALTGPPPDEAGLDPEPSPIVAARAAVGVGTDPLARARAWFAREHGPIRILTTTGAGVATALLLSLPFALSPIGLVEQLVKTAGGYPYLTVNAYNPWALVTQGANGLAANGAWLCDLAQPGRCPDPVLIGPFWAVVIGSALILAAVIGLAIAVAWRPDRRTTLVGLTVLAIAFFVLPTRVHERYLYPFFALGAILAALSLRWRIGYLVLVVANFLNLYVVLTTLYPGNPSISDWLGIGPAIRSQTGVTLIAIAHFVVFVWAVLQLRPAGRRALAAETAAAGGTAPPTGAADPTTAIPAGRPARAGRARGARARGAARRGRLAPAGAAASVVAMASPQRPMASEPRPSLGGGPGPREPGEPIPQGGDADAEADTDSGAEPGFLEAIRRRVMVRPVRADRSRALHGERGGRFDRLDVWLLVVLVIATLSFRLYRLAEPLQMHFDEVYHARTATEFLQKWRYGMDHAIYEYTHPHVAKYAMAAGIVLFGHDQVTATSDLGVPVEDATIEGRWDDPSMPGDRAGDRLYVATGQAVRAYDLASRALVATIPVPGAQAVTVDPAGHRLFIGTADGSILVVDTSIGLDALRLGSAPIGGLRPDPFATAGAPVTHLLATADGSAVLAITANDDVIAFDGATGTELGRVALPGAAALVEAGTREALIARPSEIPDPARVAAALAAITGGDAATYQQELTGGASEVVLPVALTDTLRPDIQAAIDDGRLAGLSIESRAQIAVADAAGVTFVSAVGQQLSQVALPEPATGLALITGVNDPELYVASADSVATVKVGGGATGTAPGLDTRIQMPGPVTDVRYDSASRFVQVLGARADGSPTVYTIEPHGNAIFQDAALPWTPGTWVIDQAPDYPSADRQQLLLFSHDGTTASVDIGKTAFSWRLPGVLAGVLTAALLYLLTRLLFFRRAVAVIVAVVAAVDPMLFVQSRIGMNDVYAGLFIVAAITLFAAIWLGAWRWRGAFWVAMPLVGVLLGLGLASKWVGAYAIGAVGLLYLARSALGRLLLLGGLIGLTTVLGYWAVAVPAGETGGGNLTFMLIMIAITLLAVVVAVLRPVAWSADEIRFAIGGPVVAGVAVFLGSIALGAARGSAGSAVPGSGPAIAFGLIVLGGLAYLAFEVGRRLGFGPLARPPGPDDPASLLPRPSPPPPGWLRPGWLAGIPLLWFALSVLVVPIVVYVITYIPWAFIDGHQIVPGWPPGHTGQTLQDLTAAMYNYHNTLRATHPATSPWWAWPLDLKPVWFYQGSFAGATAAAIYDHGSLVTWWLAIPATAFVTWEAFKRRSLALALLVIVFLSMWIPWARIDRATFQYHWYSTLPFILIALAYFLAELWHGPSRRTWLLAKVSAAVAVMGPVILWLLKAPLCTLAGVERVYASSPACVGNPGDLVVTFRVAGIALVTIVAAILIIRQLIHLDRPDESGLVDAGRRLRDLAITAVGAVVALGLAGFLPDAVIVSLPGLRSELVALVIGIPLAAVAWVVLTARDARRFAAGALIGAVIWTIILYPNIAALPLPSVVMNAYQGILPTYLYPFQFAVNTEPAVTPPSILALGPAVLLGALVLTGLIVAYSAYVWRLTLAERAATRVEGHGPGAPAGRA